MKTFKVIVYRNYAVSERYEVEVQAADETGARGQAENLVRAEAFEAQLLGDPEYYDHEIEADEEVTEVM